MFYLFFDEKRSLVFHDDEAIMMKSDTQPIVELSDLIILRIFSHLRLSSIVKCRQVCKRWDQLGSETLSKRKCHVQTFLFHTDKWVQVKKIGQRKSIQAIKYDEFVSEMRVEMSKLNKFTSIVILFMINQPSQCYLIHSEDKTSQQPKSKMARLDMGIMDQFDSLPYVLDQKLLPKSAIKLEVHCKGIVGTNVSRTKTIEVESDYKQAAFAGLALPESPYFRFSLITKPEDPNLSLNTESDLYEWVGLRKNHETLRYFLVMFKPKLEQLVKRNNLINSVDKIRKSVKSDQDEFLVSGGIVHGLVESQLPNDKVIKILVLSERRSDSRSVQIAQIVVPDLPIDLMREVWSEKVTILKKNNKLFDSENPDEKFSMFAIQITCIARGRDYFGGENYESSLFHDSFPNVPLVGFFGVGELGSDYLYMNSEQINNLAHPEYYYDKLKKFAYTTIFTIFSLRN